MAIQPTAGPFMLFPETLGKNNPEEKIITADLSTKSPTNSHRRRLIY